jgi:hypothetical protein
MVASTASSLDCNSSFDVYDESTAALAACGISTYPLVSQGTLSDGGTTYTYDVGSSVETYLVPPAGFNLATASASEIALYHLTNYIAAAENNPVAEAELPYVTFSAPTSFVATVPVQNIATSSIWAGHMADSDTAGEYWEANAFYNEPELYSSRCTTNAESTWAGLDGNKNETNDLAQAGTIAGNALAGTGFVQHQSWSEVSPGQPGAQPQVPIATVGKEFSTSTVYNGGTGSNSQFTFVLINEYTGSGTIFDVTANGWVGYDAEWVVERPTINGSASDLSNFETLTFDQSEGNNAYSIDLSDQFPLEMYDQTTKIEYAAPTQLNEYGGFTVGQINCGIS